MARIAQDGRKMAVKVAGYKAFFKTDKFSFYKKQAGDFGR